MIKIIVIIFFLLNYCNIALASLKEKIIYNLQVTNNLSFKFIQTVGKNNEEGYCIIKYDKKIYCEYNDKMKKIIVSNGKSLVIKSRKDGAYYLYPLKKTPLDLLLDKNFLISKIKSLEPREIDNKYVNFEILENDNKINIFFEKKTFNLVGWQTEDIYQNLTITFISSLKINENINENMFKLPKNN